MVKLSPSILSADFSNLMADIKKVEAAQVDYLHIDVMDGHFVPNISFGNVVLNSIKDKTRIPFDVHLMIENPDFYVEDFVKNGADIITVHVEASAHIHRSIQKIKELGVKAGVSLNPGTPLSTIEEILGDVDMVLLMSVNPGFGGQSFIESTINKIERLAKMRDDRGLDFEINIDGGVKINNCKRIADAGADVLVAGSAIFKTDNIDETVKAFRKELGA